MTEPLCFCCGKVVSPSLRDENPWECPGEALRFIGEGTFGSTFYDMIACPDGEVIQVIICDDCLNKHEDRIRKMKYTKKFISEEVE